MPIPQDPQTASPTTLVGISSVDLRNGFDNITIGSAELDTKSVLAPGTMVLLGGNLLGLGSYGRKHRKRWAKWREEGRVFTSPPLLFISYTLHQLHT